MASGSIVGPTMTPSNSKYTNRKWYCKLDWTRTDYETYSSIQIIVTFVADYSGDWGQVGNYLRGNGYINSIQGINFEGESWSASGGGEKVVGTYTQNINRTASNQTITISGSVWLTSNSAYTVDNGTGKSTASTNIVVPAFDHTTMRVKVNNVWKDCTVYVKINGQWKKPTVGYTKINGAWKQLK